MSKILYVSSAVQAALLSQVFIPELMDGFWKNHRPAGHGEIWRDVEVKVSTDGTLGPVGFEIPRNYNFLNHEFFVANEQRLVDVAIGAKSNSNSKYVKKELIELSRIVGKRLASRDGQPLKLYRGNHKPGTVTVSSSKARQAAQALQSAAVAPTKVTVKKTVVKTAPSVTINSDGVTIQKTAAGATVRRIAV